MTIKQIKKLIEEKELKSIDLKYSDLMGNWYHISFPVR